MVDAATAPSQQGAGPQVFDIFVVAAEESGDRLGAALMRALEAKLPGRVRFQGIGGAGMAAAGLTSLFPTTELAILGFTSIPARLRLILRRIREAAAAVAAARPHVLVIIDSPDFTHRVARQVRALAPDIPIVDYVSPTVWAWRPGRAKAMRGYIDHVMAILPFEPGVHARLGGPPCTYVGHPLVEQIGELRPSAEEEARRRADPPRILVLPGSRGSEIRRMADIFGRTMARVAERLGEVDIVVPTVPHHAERVAAATRGWPLQPRIIADLSEKRAAFRTARAALAKSGTVTLELALAGVPMVTAYKVSPIEAIVAGLLIRVPSVILANLVLGTNAVPEFLQLESTPKKLADALIPLVSDSESRRRQLAAFARLDDIMQIGQAAPSQRAAAIVLALAERGRAAGAPGNSLLAVASGNVTP